METIDYKNKTLKDDLSVEIKKGSKVSIAAECFSIYAFAELKDKLIKQIENLEMKACKESQSKKKFELFQQIKEYQNKLKEI